MKTNVVPIAFFHTFSEFLAMFPFAGYDYNESILLKVKSLYDKGFWPFQNENIIEFGYSVFLVYNSEGLMPYELYIRL